MYVKHHRFIWIHQQVIQSKSQFYFNYEKSSNKFNHLHFICLFIPKHSKSPEQHQCEVCKLTQLLFIMNVFHLFVCLSFVMTEPYQYIEYIHVYRHTHTTQPCFCVPDPGRKGRMAFMSLSSKSANGDEASSAHCEGFVAANGDWASSAHSEGICRCQLGLRNNKTTPLTMSTPLSVPRVPHIPHVPLQLQDSSKFITEWGLNKCNEKGEMKGM